MSEFKLVPVETIRHAIDALELYASNTLAGTHSAHELRKTLLDAPAVQGEPVAISHDLARNAANHLTNWLEMDICECEGGHYCGYNEVKRTRDALLEAAEQHPTPNAPAPTFRLGDHVRKTKGSQWKGRVVGTYSTSLTPEGYAVESDTEKGSVQIYPVGALELVVEDVQKPEPDVSALVEALEWLRGAVNCAPSPNDKYQSGTWISTRHPRIKQIDKILAAHRKQGGE